MHYYTRLIGHFLLGVEMAWTFYWFAIVMFFNSVGGPAFTLEQGLYDTCIRVVAMAALGHILHKMHHDHKEKRHMHWTPVLVILAVALFSSRGLIRYVNIYNNNFPANPIHINLLASVLLSSFALSCLEIIWLSRLIFHGFSIELPTNLLIFNVQLTCGKRRKHHKEFDESVVELNPLVVNSESNVNMRSTPLVGLRQKINNYGI